MFEDREWRVRKTTAKAKGAPLRDAPSDPDFSGV
jgi:hypothetical protein